MKKICAILILTASASMLTADNYGSYSGQYPQSAQNQYGQYSGYSQNQGYNPAGQQYSQTPQGTNQGEGNVSQNDQQLTNKMRDFVRTAFSKYNNVNFNVNNGTVTLTGTVSSQDDKNNLEQTIRKIFGVNVDNQITVQNPNQGS